MMLSLRGRAGSTISLDFRKRFGERVELECFHFVIPPTEFRLVHHGKPLQKWESGTCEMFDLQHGPGVEQWMRGGHSFINDLDHRSDVMTCGVLSAHVAMETRGLALDVLLMVWLRDGSFHS